MDTLPNVDISEKMAASPYVGLETDVIPEAKSSKTGVSVKYAMTPERQWFVLRASYGREALAANVLIEKGVYVYLPLHHVKKMVRGQMKRMLVPIVPNLIFAYATADEIDYYIQTAQLSFLSYYYDHFHKEAGKNPPLVVPHDMMLNFIRATRHDSEHVMLVDPSQCHFRKGDRVKVIGGLFEGVEGFVARVAGQQRVVVTLKGVCSVATAYIPTAFIKGLEQQIGL